MAIALAVYLLLAWLLTGPMGNHGLWSAMAAFMVVRALTLAAWYPRILRQLEEPVPAR